MIESDTGSILLLGIAKKETIPVVTQEFERTGLNAASVGAVEGEVARCTPAVGVSFTGAIG